MIKNTFKKNRIFFGGFTLCSLGMAILFALPLGTKSVAAKSPQPQTGTPAFAYVLDCDGTYLRLDVSTAQILSQGFIGENPSGSNLQSVGWVTRLDGCFVGTKGQHDPQLGLVYFVFSEGGGSPRKYSVAALRLPNFEVVAKLDLPLALDWGVRIHLTPDSSEMLVSSSFMEPSPTGGDPLKRVVLARYSVPDFTLLRTVLDKTYTLDAPYFEGTFVRANRFWDSQGRIIDGDKILDENGKLLERIRVHDFLPAPLRRALKHLERVGAKGKGYLSTRFIDSAAGRMLFLIRDDRRKDTERPGSGLVVYDVGLRQIVSGIVTPYSASGSAYGGSRPTVHLTPNGEYIVLEQYEWRERSPEDTTTNLKRFKTGEIHVYSVDTRDLLFSVKLDPPPGFMEGFVGFSPDGQFMIYDSWDNLYAVRLTETPGFQVLPKPEGFRTRGVIFSNK